MKSNVESTYNYQRNVFRDLAVDFGPSHKKDEIHRTAPVEFDRLVRSQKFPQVVVCDGVFLAKTRFVWIPVGEKVYRLGEYVIEIGKHYFSAQNLTMTVSDHHHPHINAAGSFCMSSGHEEIMRLIKDGWLAQAAYAIESTLWLIGPGMQYQQASLGKWPVEPDGKEKRDD